MTTPTEQAFLTMAKMAGLVERLSADCDWSPTAKDDQIAWLDRTAATPKGLELVWCRNIAENHSDLFPIVASTFEALTIERPELREHYDRAKQAWEASQ